MLRLNIIVCASLSLFFSPYSFVSFSSHPHTVFVLLIGALQVYYFAPCFLNVFYSARLPINSSSVFTFTHTHIRVRTLNTHTRSVYICYHSKVLVITRARVRVRERESMKDWACERETVKKYIRTHTNTAASEEKRERPCVFRVVSEANNKVVLAHTKYISIHNTKRNRINE